MNSTPITSAEQRKIKFPSVLAGLLEWYVCVCEQHNGKTGESFFFEFTEYVEHDKDTLG